MKYYDMIGKEIHIGDIVAKPWTVNGSPSMSIGKVTKINEKTITIQELRFDKEVPGIDGSLFIIGCDPYYGEEHWVRTPNRCLILNTNMLIDIGVIKTN